MSRASSNILPEGLVFQADFLGVEEEHALIDFIRTLPYGVVTMRGVSSRRRIAQFGFRYDFDSARLTPTTPLSLPSSSMFANAPLPSPVSPPRNSPKHSSPSTRPAPASAGTRTRARSESSPEFRSAPNVACAFRRGRGPGE
jgi:hypothetical protein